MTLTKQQFLDKIPNYKNWNYLKDFLEKITDDTHKLSEYHSGVQIDNLNIDGRNYLVKIDNDRGYVEFIDELVDFKRFANNLGKDIIYEWSLAFRKLYDDILYGNNFYLADNCTGGNADYTWFMVTCSVEKFREEKLFSSLEMWSKFNKEQREKFNLKLGEVDMGDHCSSCGLELQIYHEMGKDFFEETDGQDNWIICKECKDHWDGLGDKDYSNILNKN